jgi:hypothetical protein
MTVIFCIARHNAYVELMANFTIGKPLVYTQAKQKAKVIKVQEIDEYIVRCH